jgi:hypothetical protein
MMRNDDEEFYQRERAGRVHAVGERPGGAASMHGAEYSLFGAALRGATL